MLVLGINVSLLRARRLPKVEKDRGELKSLELKLLDSNIFQISIRGDGDIYLGS